MRLKDLINDEEYVGEKKRLAEEKARLERSLLEDPIKRSLDLTAETFNFAARAKKNFQNGSQEDKRTILQELGSNLFLKDKKLEIQLEKPFQIIERGLRVFGGENEALEPLKTGSFEAKSELSDSVFPSWWTTVEDVRTFYRDQQDIDALLA